MGVVRDITVEQLTSAIGDIDTSGLAKDTTLQAVVSALQNLQINVTQTASNVSYNNLASGLTATNVQGAIDEVCNDLIQTKTYTASYTVGGNASGTITANDFNATIPSGYTPIGISDFATQSTSVVVRGIYGRATGNNTMMAIRNETTTSVTATAYVTIMYIKSLFI